MDLVQSAGVKSEEEGTAKKVTEWPFHPFLETSR